MTELRSDRVAEQERNQKPEPNSSPTLCRGIVPPPGRRPVRKGSPTTNSPVFPRPRVSASSPLLLLLVITISAVELELTFDGAEDQDALPAAVTKAGEKAYSLNQQGLEALEREDLDTALALFREAAETLPGYSDAVNNQGVVHFRRGTLFRAREIWETVTEADPDYAIAHYNLGVAAFHGRKYDQAADHLRTALDKNRRFHQALVMLGRIDLLQGRKRDAVRRLEKAYEIAPNAAEVWSMTAYGLVEAGDTARAEELLLQRTDTHQSLEMLGKIESGRGRYERAAEYLAQAVARGGPTSILVSLASVQMDAGQCGKALGTLDAYLARARPPSADAYLLAGVAAKDCGDMAVARKRFEEGVRRYPGDPILRFNLGQMLFYGGEYERAENVWAPLADTLSDPSLFHLRAVTARRRGDHDRAEELIRKALTMDKRAEYYDALGVVLHDKGDSAAAVASFRKAVEIDPGLRSAQLNLALATKEKGALGATARELRRRLDTCSLHCGEPALKLAIVHYHGGDIDRALEVLRGVPEGERTEGIARHEAIFLRMKGDLAGAVSVLEKAKGKYVFEVETEHELAQCYMEAGLHGKAIATFESLLERWNRNPWRIFYQMGYASMEQNELSRAQTYFERSLRVKRSNPAARALLAFVLNRMGDSERARELWEKNLKDDPSNPVMWSNMGLALEKEGRYEEALERYRRALRLKPEEHGVRINMGNAYLALGRYGEALDAYREALDSPKRQVAAYNAFIAAQGKREMSRAGEMVELLRSEYPGELNTKRAGGEMALWKGDTARALEVLSGLAEKNANDWYALARIYIAKGKSREAEHAIGCLPDDPRWVHVRKELRAQQAYFEGRYDRAYELWDALEDTSFSTRYNKALAALKGKRYAEAMRLGQSMIRTADGRDRVDVCRLIGNAAFGLKQWDTARKWYEQLSGLDSRNPVVQYNLAVAWYNLDDIDRSWKHYQQARALDPALSNSDIEKRHKAARGEGPGTTVMLDTLDSLYNEAVTLQSEENDTAAMEIYRQILEIDTRYYQAWNNLGAIHAKRGELDLAKDCYAKAISRRHDLVEAYANLANIHIALGEFDKARRWLFKGGHHNPDNELIDEMKRKLEEARAAEDEGEVEAEPEDR